MSKCPREQGSDAMEMKILEVQKWHGWARSEIKSGRSSNEWAVALTLSKERITCVSVKRANLTVKD